MGYTTEFNGSFALNKPLAPEHQNYLEAFSETRRMRRDAAQTADRSDPVRVAAGLLVGPEGAFFVGGDGPAGQEHSSDIINYNQPPSGQPGLWCHWVPVDGGTAIEWDGGEKFYDYVSWIKYIIENFLEPWGYNLSGDVAWLGEDSNDRGIIWIKDNEVEPLLTEVNSPLPSWYEDAVAKSSTPVFVSRKQFILGLTEQERFEMTATEVAHKADCSPSYVRQVWKKAGLEWKEPDVNIEAITDSMLEDE
jgi:hypothetical protein